MSWRALVDRLTFEHRQRAYTRMAIQAMQQYEQDLNAALTSPSRVAASHEFMRRLKVTVAQEVVKRAATSLQVEHAELNVITEDQQITIAAVDTVGAVVREPINCDDSWCRHVIALGRDLAIDDATQHALVRGTEPARSGAIVSYLGSPVVSNGYVVGVLCVYESRRREWTEQDAKLLHDITEGLSAG